MSPKSQNTDIFQSELVDSATIDGLVLAIYENGLLLVKVPKYFSITMEVFTNCQKYIRKHGEDKRYHFIFEFASFSEVDPELRKRRATADGTEFSLSDALVISNLPQKMMGDFYLKFNKPVRPTKFFYSLDKALEWSLKQKEKTES
ncbi:MAG: hypothetical protein NXI10_07635 [bacterium]|nr:hypothetical protein [bacterium]